MSDAKTVAIAEVILTCSAQINAMSNTDGLTGAQWAALRYFGSANAVAANLASFAKHHGTTKGTASRTITRLVAKDLLVRTQDGVDKRRRIIQVTRKGQRVLKTDPALKLGQAIAESDIKDLDGFRRAILALMKHPLIATTASAGTFDDHLCTDTSPKR